MRDYVPDEYDLVVIGGGPAGYRTALDYARHRPEAKVALVERMAVVGGVCVNTGTIPSKTLREAVRVLSRSGDRMDRVNQDRPHKDGVQADLVRRIQQVIDLELALLEKRLAKANVKLLLGSARFVNAHEIEVIRSADRTEHRLRAQSIVIATGSEAVRTPGLPYDGETVLVPDELITLKELPSSLIIVGAGVIGSEYASIYGMAGIPVTLVDGRTRILDFLDREVVGLCLEEMQKNGVTLRLGKTIERVERTSQNTVRVLYKEGGSDEADLLVTAAGRVGGTAGLHLHAAGLTADERGRILVDGNYRTRVPHIFAVGDVIGFPSLAATATEQGRVVAAVAAGLPPPPLSSLLPFGIYTIPEMAAVGASEEALRAEAVPYETARGSFSETSRGHIAGIRVGMLKLLWHRDTREILGVHIVGEGATELVHLGHAVMALRGTVDYFVESVFNYPTLAQVYKLAADEIAARSVSH